MVGFVRLFPFFFFFFFVYFFFFFFYFFFFFFIYIFFLFLCFGFFFFNSILKLFFEFTLFLKSIQSLFYCICNLFNVQINKKIKHAYSNVIRKNKPYLRFAFTI